MLTAEQVIALLDLKPLPREGGFYRETYRSEVVRPYRGRDKSAGTAIYYLLTPNTCSALHRLPIDEVFHFYLGDRVQMLQLYPDGQGRVLTLGTDLRAGERPQVVVPQGVWQGSLLLPGGTLALLGTTMAPGFDFDDYEAADRAALTARYPEYREWIAKLTP
jgi:predicted cupin superfamily sugar epimerase